MLNRNKTRSHTPFERPRTPTLNLRLTIHSGDLMWYPAIAWEVADTDYFAATAAPLQTLSLRAPAGFTPSNSRHPVQLPNIAGRWALKLNPVQAQIREKKIPTAFEEKHLGWAETHAIYSTFTATELVILLDESAGQPGAKALVQLITAHCIILENAGSLRIMPADKHTHDHMIDICGTSTAASKQVIHDIGSPMLTPNPLPVRKFTVFDIDPAAWLTSGPGCDFAKALNWVKKNRQ